MPNGIFLRSPSEPLNPGAGIPYAENDKAIVRGVTRGFIDPSNPVCYSGAGKLDNTTPLQDLIFGGGVATPDGVLGTDAASALSGGLVQAANATAAGGAKIALPAPFVLPATCKRALIGFSCKLPLNGYGNAGTAYMGVLAVASTSAPASNQYIFGFRIVDGVVTSADKSISFDGGNISAGNIADYIAAVCNGALHQVHLFVDSRADKRIVTLFVDGAVFATAAAAWNSVNTNINVPAGVNPYALGAQSSFSPPGAAAVRAGNAKFGRFQVHDLTGTEIDPLTIVQADYQSARRYLS